MNKLVASSIAIAVFLLAGCAASGPKLASSAEDIAGTWQSTISSAVVQINEDGTSRSLGSLSTGVDFSIGKFRFEETRLFLTDRPDTECSFVGFEAGIYEVELLENGNLKFVVIEDECLTRINYLAGRLVEAEWEPVP